MASITDPSVPLSANDFIEQQLDERLCALEEHFSRLGPIDPQAERPDGRLVPALGYLERYNSLINKAQTGTITTAEVQLLIDGFDQAELYQYEHARELSISLLKKWLVSYKFKTWTTIETRCIPVTPQMREERAEEIARQLSDTQKWHSHGHGISRDVLENDLNLRIDDFGSDEALKKIIRDYHTLLEDYRGKMGHRGVVHTAGNYRPFG